MALFLWRCSILSSRFIIETYRWIPSQVHCELDEQEKLVAHNITTSLRDILTKQVQAEMHAVESTLMLAATPKRMEIDDKKYKLTCPRANGLLPVYDSVVKSMQEKTYLTLWLFPGTLQMSDGLGVCQLDPACNSVSNTLPLHQRLSQQPWWLPHTVICLLWLWDHLGNWCNFRISSKHWTRRWALGTWKITPKGWQQRRTWQINVHSVTRAIGRNYPCGREQLHVARLRQPVLQIHIEFITTETPQLGKQARLNENIHV